MATYVNKDNNFEQAEPTSRECPHCGAQARLLPLATPSFEVLSRTRPRHTGLVFRCSACNEPRFVRLAVRSYAEDRIELSSTLIEVERTKERFAYRYLPERIERLFRETLACYSADCFSAFAAMCRCTARASSRQLGRNGKLRWNEMFQNAVMLADVEAGTTRKLETVLFGADDSLPDVSADEAAVLIEVTKDILYQLYVRSAKLKAALKMRRYFAGESTRTNVTPLSPRGRRAESA